jgi:hypothetical protein
MNLLIAIAAGCCVVLVGVAAALWWSIRQEHRRPEEHTQKPFAVVQQVRKAPHPRMDLAAGIAAGAAAVQQRVRGSDRRRGVRPDETEEATVVRPTRAGLPERRIAARRLDWAYFNGEPGDLSDPDLKRAPAGGVRPLGRVSLPESS